VNFCLWHEPAALPISGSAIYGLFADPDPPQILYQDLMGFY